MSKREEANDSAAAGEDAVEVRRIWVKPSVRRIVAGAAENGFAQNVADALFTGS